MTLEFSLFGVPIFRGMEGVRVNLNCALCHTATYRTTENDKPIVVPGAPAHQLRADEALRFLRECAKGLTARKIINAKGNLSWRERLRYYLVVPPLRRKILDSPEQAAFAKTHPWGPGRFDALNGSKIRVLGMPYDESRGVADMPAVWRLNPNHARNWDGNHLSLTEAIRAEALATGTPKSALDKVVDDVSSVRCEDPEASTDSYGKREGKPIDEELLCLKRYLQSLSPPRFPFAPTNEAEGKRLFLEHCANCHAEHNGRPTRVGTVIPLEAIGTDPSRLRAWSPEAVKEKNELGKGHAWRISQSRKTEGYVAVPLDGIWLRAPYLHNGAVPTLRDLLEDPKDRPPAFCRGYDVIDFKDVGFFSNFVIKGRCEKEEREFSVFDTSKPGNGNGGHVFGTQLSPEEKGRLLEYLKTL
ncbi:MAG: hypothetical protein HYZ50_24470 [Deltaproteobacteria bacterium]|nr:hypothetical protein [Deltaproteobacteria bacterium]